MNKSLYKGLFAITVLVVVSLACSALGGGAIIEDDFAGSDSAWGIGTDADSAVEYVNDALNFFITL